MTMRKNSVFIFFTAILFYSVSTGALADDALAIKAKSLAGELYGREQPKQNSTACRDVSRRTPGPG
jgi:hypothetical protein